MMRHLELRLGPPAQGSVVRFSTCASRRLGAGDSAMRLGCYECLSTYQRRDARIFIFTPADF